MKVRLGDVFSVIRNGASIKQKDGAIGYPITRIETISERYVNRNKLGYADIINIAKYNKFILEDEDILMSHINSEKHLAKVALYKRKQGETIIHGMNLLMLRADRQYIAPSYAVLLFESNRFLNTIKTISKKSVNQASFTVTALKDIVIQLPDLKIQEKIANQINAVSHSISLQKKCVLLLEQLVKSRFMEMFGDPVTNNKNWLTSQLSNHIELIGGYAFESSKLNTSDGIPVVKIGNINSGIFKATNLMYSEKLSHLAKYKLFPGDLVISLTGTIGKEDYANICIMGNDYSEYYLNQRNAKIQITNSLEKYYLVSLLRFNQIKRQITNVSRGVRQANVSNKDILTLTIPLPPLPLQQQFAAFVEKVDKSKLAVKQSLEKLETLKKSLMQQYFG